MRGLRSLIVLVVIAAALGWYVYRDATREAVDDEPRKEKVFSVEADKIDEIALKSERGEQTRLQKAGDKGWQIVAPATAQPDPAEVSGLTSNLASLEMQR